MKTFRKIITAMLLFAVFTLTSSFSPVTCLSVNAAASTTAVS